MRGDTRPDAHGPRRQEASEPTPRGAVVRATGLTKRYGNARILRDVHLSVSRGERVAVLGLNGAGKTTLFRCCLGLTPFEGELTVDGHPAGPAGREARRRIGYLPQQPPRFDLRLEEFLEIFAALRGMAAAGPREWLRELGLPLSEHGGKSLRELSGGMLQKALLAIALGSGSPVLLLDEPTANLDATSRREFLRALGQAEESTTLLFASHRLDDVESLATRLLVLHEGGFVFDGTAAELLERAGIDVRVWLDRARPPALEEVMQALVARSGVPR
ncbi:MAG: ABC transporter ATP-binding protein [Gemmatimonadota bacterium]